MSREKIQLQLKIIEGKKYIVDQHGRELDGVLSFVSSTAVDSGDTLKLEVFQYEGGNVITCGGHQ